MAICKKKMLVLDHFLKFFGDFCCDLYEVFVKLKRPVTCDIWIHTAYIARVKITCANLAWY